MLSIYARSAPASACETQILLVWHGLLPCKHVWPSVHVALAPSGIHATSLHMPGSVMSSQHGLWDMAPAPPPVRRTLPLRRWEAGGFCERRAKKANNRENSCNKVAKLCFLCTACFSLVLGDAWTLFSRCFSPYLVRWEPGGWTLISRFPSQKTQPAGEFIHSCYRTSLWLSNAPSLALRRCLEMKIELIFA